MATYFELTWQGRRWIDYYPNSQQMLDALAIDNPLEYARLYLDSEMQDWVNAMNMEWYST